MDLCLTGGARWFCAALGDGVELDFCEAVARTGALLSVVTNLHPAWLHRRDYALTWNDDTRDRLRRMLNRPNVAVEHLDLKRSRRTMRPESQEWVLEHCGTILSVTGPPPDPETADSLEKARRLGRRLIWISAS